MNKQTDPKNNELLPCPFCGKSAILDYASGNYAIYCSVCELSSVLAISETKAKKLWNTRATPQPIDAGELLEELIRDYGGACYDTGYADGYDKDSGKGEKRAQKAEHYLGKIIAAISATQNHKAVEQ